MNERLSPYLVGGERRSSSDPLHTAKILNPFDNSIVGEVALASERDAEDAVERALAGFEKTKRLQAYERFEILSYIAAKIGEQESAFTELITAEVGKPITAARSEVRRAIATFAYAAEEARRIKGNVIPLDLSQLGRDRFGIVRRFPIGVILAITPFNFPLNLVAHKVAPAIASGNSVILKPAPHAVLTSLRLADIIMASGFPPEAMTVLPCENRLTERLVLDPRIAMMTFTGSAAVGWSLKSKAGRKKVLLELGGNAGVIVDKTANLHDAIEKNLVGSFGYSGQVCIKVQRIYVQSAVFDEYVARFVEGSRNTKSGNPVDPATLVGPLIDDAAADRVVAWIDEARTEGARILAGGGRVGRIVEPTVLLGARRDSQVYCNEVFGPVVTLHKFDSMQEAIDGVNDSRFGLQAGIFSNDHRNIFFAYNNLDVGALIVNENPTFRMDNMPYGGIKDSGFGREGIAYAIEQMTEPRMLALGG